MEPISGTSRWLGYCRDFGFCNRPQPSGGVREPAPPPGSATPSIRTPHGAGRLFAWLRLLWSTCRNRQFLSPVSGFFKAEG